MAHTWWQEFCRIPPSWLKAESVLRSLLALFISVRLVGYTWYCRSIGYTLHGLLRRVVG